MKELKKALLVVGNRLRGDDGVAPYLGDLVQMEALGWKIFYGEDVPENEFNKIRAYAPDLIVVADAMTGMNVGRVEIMNLSDDKDYMYSTHDIPMPILISYLRGFCEAVLFLGLNVDIINTLEIKEELSETAIKTAQKGLEKLKEIEKVFEEKN